MTRANISALAVLYCVAALLTAPAAFGAGAIRVPDGNVTLENGYLDLTTGKGIIFPDGVQSGKATSVPGPPGADGVNGKTLLNGTVDPTTEGVDGDFYINTASNKIFGPKAAGAWPAGVSLVGPAGATGPAGANYTPPRAPVLATGQVTSYAVGDDGDWMPGASLPAAQRFYDNGDGTVKDNLTGLIWLKNANCSATLGGVVSSGAGLDWFNAITWSNNLASGSCGLTDGSTAGQWRLPNRTELQSLVDYSKSSPALPAGYATYFSNVQTSGYWSGSIFALMGFWCVGMDDGHMVNCNEVDFYYVWPVRAGQ